MMTSSPGWGSVGKTPHSPEVEEPGGQLGLVTALGGHPPRFVIFLE